ncbi:MAG: UDP-glucose 4-epimerase GalE [Phycisphaerae bacterium]|jgi:UDP-glucose 4-epimerase|nr:UDP-glucose 4-epimerase GalE [Phycisphaerae bacterium]
MRIFITGGAGYVGSHCARLLRESGHELCIYDNLSAGHRGAVEASELVVGDLADVKKLHQTMSDFGPEAVMHFAASTAVGESVKEPLLYYRNNVVNTVNLLEVMKSLEVKKLVFSSTCATYGVPPKMPITEDMPTHPLSPYGRTKLIMEQVYADCSRAWGLGFAALRYFNASGASFDVTIGEDHKPETHLIPIVLQVALGQREQVEIFGDDYPTPDGTCIRDYIHVEDLADAHQRALLTLTPGKQIIVNLGTGSGHSVKEVIDVTEKVTGKKINVKMGPRREGDTPSLYADPTNGQKVLGWQAKVTNLEDIIQTAWEWHREHPNGFAE